MKDCNNRLENDIESYTPEEYARMEEELADSINQLIEETAKKYCVQPMIETESPRTKVSVFIVNRGIHNNPPFLKDLKG
ncbi:MAG: hypothetical protein CML16_04925 [Pusillimonas sp.]|nr:hypothetical protein [Pusillimonas sp.]|tara:strand:+ start:7124 stop:7360 length:237 start_codon:yes stop_codon:yes gene_type:complete